MIAKIIAVVNQKGGAGKTTVSMQLAGTLGRRGHKVLIIDADPQATATRWAASASDEQAPSRRRSAVSAPPVPRCTAKRRSTCMISTSSSSTVRLPPTPRFRRVR